MRNLLNIFFSVKREGIYRIITFFGLRWKIKDKKKEMFNAIKKDFEIKIKNLENLSLQRIRKITPFSSIEVIEIHIVEHCNLHCKGCTHFSPLAQKEC